MEKILEHWKEIVSLLAILGIGIEVVPVKVYPIKFIGKLIGKWLNSDTNIKLDKLGDKVDKLENKVDKLEVSGDFKEIKKIKNDLSNYHAILLKRGLDEHQYRRCFELEDDYKKYKKKYPGKVNGHMETVFESIRSNYEKGNILDFQENVITYKQGGKNGKKRTTN